MQFSKTLLALAAAVGPVFAHPHQSTVELKLQAAAYERSITVPLDGSSVGVGPADLQYNIVTWPDLDVHCSFDFFDIAGNPVYPALVSGVQNGKYQVDIGPPAAIKTVSCARFAY